MTILKKIQNKSKQITPETAKKAEIVPDVAPEIAPEPVKKTRKFKRSKK